MHTPSPGLSEPTHLAAEGPRVKVRWAFLGNAVYSACQWLCLVALVRMGDAEMTGRFAFALAVATPVLLLTNLALSALLATDIPGAYRFGEYLGLRLVTAGAGLLIVGAVALLQTGGGPTTSVLLLAGVVKTVDAIGDIFLGLFQQRCDMLALGVSLALNGSVSVAVFTAALALTRSVSWALAGSVVGSVVALTAYQVPRARKILGAASLRPLWHAPRSLRLARMAVPVGFVSLRFSLMSAVPRYFLRAVGEAELGVFAALSALTLPGSLVLVPLLQSAAPRLARKASGRDADGFSRLLGRTLATALALGAAGWLAVLVAGEPLIALLLSRDYAPFAGILAWQMAAMAIAFLLAVFETGATALRVLWLEGALQVVGLAVLVVSCALLVPRHGMAGAAAAMVVASAVPLLGYVISAPILRRRI